MIERCAKAILNLLPYGVGITKDLTSNIYKLALGLAEEFCRIEQRAAELLVEIDPRSTTELISDWERVLGLPGECIDLAETLADRRAAVVAKLISRSAQTKAFYIQLAASIGYTITEADITEPSPHTFAFNIPLTSSIRSFRASANRVGDRLREWGNELFECVMEDNKPAHTQVLFLYT